MKEIGEDFEFINEIEKKKIFKVTDKKRILECNSKKYYQSKQKKKKLFIIQKLQNNTNEPTLNFTQTKIFNENNININININEDKIPTINNVHFQNSITQGIVKVNNDIKLNEIKNQELNKINNFNNKNNNINNETKNDNNKNKPSKKYYGDYICLDKVKIGSGSFGEVLYGVHKTLYREVAVKLLNSDTTPENIKREINFTKKLQGCQGFPTLYYCGKCNNNNIIVESLLGPSLDKLFQFCGKKFPLKTVCLIGIEIVKRLETMHEKGLLHRDLKPNNLAWGNYNNSYNYIPLNNSNMNNFEKLDINTIYLIDFGLSCSYWDRYTTEPQKHYKPASGLNFIGTLRYASLNSHKGYRQSRRDDLESMLYILIYFLKGKLPWQDVGARTKDERYKLILEKKSNIRIDFLCKDIPGEFADLLRYVKTLNFEEKPMYNKFYCTFQYIISKLNYEEIQEKNYYYIWEKILVDIINNEGGPNYNKNLDEIKKSIYKGYPINLKKFAEYIIYNNKIMNESLNRKKEIISIGDSTESSGK